MDRNISFEDWDIGGVSGYPSIAFCDPGLVVVSDYSGFIRSIETKSMTVRSKVFVSYKISGVPMPEPLCSLCVNPANSKNCSVAIRCGYAVLWDIGEKNFKPIYPNLEGPVNCVAFSNDGNKLALGIGFYPLHAALWGTRGDEAGVEVWRIDEEEPVLEASTRLPGVCTDCIAWDRNDYEIACVTGSLYQKQGFLIRLNAGYLSPVKFIETQGVVARNIEYEYFEDQDSPERLVVGYGRGLLNSYPLSEEPQDFWSYKISEDKFDFCCDMDAMRVFTINGKILDANDGSIIGEFEPLGDCSSLKIYPPGGLVGISTKGILRIWKSEALKGISGTS